MVEIRLCSKDETFREKSIFPLARNQLFSGISMLLSPLPSFNSETRHVHKLNLLGWPGFSETDHRDLCDGAIRGSFGYPKAEAVSVIQNPPKINKSKKLEIENVADLKKLIHSSWWFSRCPANLRRHVCASYHISTAFGCLFPKRISVKGSFLRTVFPPC